MKMKTKIGLIGLTIFALASGAFAAGHGGGGGFGGGGFGPGPIGGGHIGGGGGFHGSARGFNAGHPAYFYSRGMHYTQPRGGQFRPVAHASRPTARVNRGTTNTVARSGQPRMPFNGRTDHISER